MRLIVIFLTVGLTAATGGGGGGAKGGNSKSNFIHNVNLLMQYTCTCSFDLNVCKKMINCATFFFSFFFQTIDCGKSFKTA